MVLNPRQIITGTLLKAASTFICVLAGQLICACGRIRDQPELKRFLFVSSFTSKFGLSVERMLLPLIRDDRSLFLFLIVLLLLFTLRYEE